MSGCIPGCLADRARKAGLDANTVRARVKRGWSIERALSVPAYSRKQAAIDKGEKRCVDCGEVKPVGEYYRLSRRDGREFQSRCKVCEAARCRQVRETLRHDLISHYSQGTMQCAECGEARMMALDLDHIDGGGRKDREAHKTPQAFYQTLQRRGFPPGFRVLCKNCNWIAWIERKEKNHGR